MSVFRKFIFSVVAVLLLTGFVSGQRRHGARPTNSGGPLIYEQAAFDVTSYEISTRVYPAKQSISGTTIIAARIVLPTDKIVIDLDTPFQVSGVSSKKGGKFEPLKYKRKEGRIWVYFPHSKQPNAEVRVRIEYSGKPRIAPNPPWVGGFMWKKTADGSDWITVACQNDGADIWFPSKDHPSDEPDSVSLHITVPENLFVASVGKLQRVRTNSDKTKTFDWFMSNPINNYNVVLNIAPYKIVEQNYKSVAGETFPIKFYALPESVGKAKDIVDQTAKFLAFYEKFLGPYPYRKEKLGIAETPHLGMEHSTIIAYGNKFATDQRGFDWLMLHELGHEWWGNMVTASDWRDMWLHEGFQVFMDSLYIEETKGKEAYFRAMKNRVKGLRNKQPIAPIDSKYAFQIYFAEPDYVTSDGDIYGKGALVLHSLRYLIGDKPFFRAIRKMAYPNKKMESITNGKQNRLVTTDDFKQIVEKETGLDLDWFFDVYLRQPELPKLTTRYEGNKLFLRWVVSKNLPFSMPIDVVKGGISRRVNMQDGKAEIDWDKDEKPIVDPNGWVLKAK